MSLDIPRGAHAFVDETKARDYLLVAAVVGPGDLTTARRAMRSLVVAGRHRVHFKKLSDSQRHRVLRVLLALPVHVVVARSGKRQQADARAAALACIAAELRYAETARLVIERDDSFAASDLAVLRSTWPDALTHHVAGATEPLLWVSDAAAWCLQRGGDWSRKLGALVVADLDADSERGPG